MSPAEWSEDIPTKGQCGPSSCVIQDYLGGEILYCVVRLPFGHDVDHYCNRVNGRVIDITWCQFESGSSITDYVEQRDVTLSNRQLILFSEQMQKKYEMLRERVSHQIL